MSKFSLLIVDDVSLIRDFMRRGLSAVLPETQILDASNGRHAQTILTTKPIDAVLCDWEMPEVTGKELLLWIRAHEKLRELPFIMITGRNERKDVIEALKLGIDGYIVKPFSIDSLADRIREVLAKRGKNIPMFAPTPAISGPFSDSVAILTGGRNAKA